MILFSSGPHLGFDDGDKGPIGHGMVQDDGARSWLKERRGLLVKNVVRDFIRAHGSFLELERQYRASGISYSGLDSWVGTHSDRGTLWLLKDNCHQLWRRSDPASTPDALFFDWLVGAVFHEAMKLKENVYLVDQYLPAYHQALTPGDDGSQGRRFEQFFEQTMHDIDKGMLRLAYLFRHGADQLRELLVQEKDNAVLLRYVLLEDRATVELLWADGGGLEPVLLRRFPEGVDRAYCMAGESYLEGSWYAEARLAFEQALKVNPGCEEAWIGLRILEKRLNEVTLVLPRQAR